MPIDRPPIDRPPIDRIPIHDERMKKETAAIVVRLAVSCDLPLAACAGMSSC